MHALRIINKDGQAPSAEEIVAANKVATTFKSATIGTFKVTDPIDDIEVEYHAHKALAFTQGGSSIYFGFDAAVEMRCKCRGVVLVETAAPDVVSVSRRINTGTSSNQSWDILVGDVVHSSHTGSVTNEPVGYNTWTNYLADLVGAWPGYIVNGISGGGETANLTFTTVTSYPAWIAAQAAADAINASSAAEANHRSAVFLTDGTELSSAPMTLAEIASGEAYEPTFVGLPWSGGSYANLFNYLQESPDRVSYVDAWRLELEVPEDVCWNAVSAPAYPERSASQETKDQWVADWAAAQAVALEREHKRRKKCSDGQMAYLRNGFLSPEFEYFIKTQHPISTLVRRDIPMQVVSRDQELVSDVTYDNDNRTRVWSASVTVKYNFVDDDGNVDPKEHTFTGTIQQVDTTHKAKNDEPIAEVSSSKFTYTNFPMLADSSTGEAYTLPSPLPALPYSASLTLKTNNAIWHDDKSYPLLVEANGTFNKSPWVEDDTYSYPSYPYDSTKLVPPVEKTSDYITFAHPQFLLDYIRDSKPVEKTTDSNGNKAPVTSSTDWLSSRLAHDEVVTIIPLSFVNADGEDRGMYPYSRTDDEVPAHVKIVGYARFKYNYFTASFSFVSFTEFTTESDIKHDGNATYDDETNPISVTVGETTYALQPKYFDYDPEYGSTNCVCIGNKAIWTDVKADAKEQKKNIADTAPEGRELTAEEKLYKAVREAIT